MTNFSDFTMRDIEAKKTLISFTTNTKSNIKNIMKIDTIMEKYSEYQKSVKK